MKDLSPFLPEPAVLSALLSHVGIEYDELPQKRARGQGIVAPPAAAPIRFLATPAQAPAQAPAREPRGLGTDDEALREVFGSGPNPTLQRRIESFVRWLCRASGVFAAFVADADGLILANQDAAEAYAEAVASVLHNEEAAFRSTPLPSERTTLIELSDSRFLQVIRVDTVAGRLVVGVVGLEPLPRAVCSQLRRVLKLCVDTESRQ